MTIGSQATAVERAAANLRGHIAKLEELVNKRQRPVHELETAMTWLPDLEAAAGTLRRLRRKRRGWGCRRNNGLADL
jgi:hypothetical protein